MDSTSITQLWPPLWSLVLTPSILGLSAITAVILLGLNIKNTREKRKLDTILKIIEYEQTEGFSRMHAAFLRVKHEDLFDRIKNPDIEEMRVLRAEVFRYLNHYEIVGISFRKGLLDKEIYRSWIAGPLVRDWNTAFDFIVTSRWVEEKDGTWEYSRRLYENYEWLANEFSSEALSAPVGSNEALERNPMRRF